MLPVALAELTQVSERKGVERSTDRSIAEEAMHLTETETFADRVVTCFDSRKALS